MPPGISGQDEALPPRDHTAGTPGYRGLLQCSTVQYNSTSCPLSDPRGVCMGRISALGRDSRYKSLIVYPPRARKGSSRSIEDIGGEHSCTKLCSLTLQRWKWLVSRSSVVFELRSTKYEGKVATHAPRQTPGVHWGRGRGSGRATRGRGQELPLVCAARESLKPCVAAGRRKGPRGSLSCTAAQNVEASRPPVASVTTTTQRRESRWRAWLQGLRCLPAYLDACWLVLLPASLRLHPAKNSQVPAASQRSSDSCSPTHPSEN